MKHLLPWQHSRFEPSLIRNTIISFYVPEWGQNGISLTFSVHWHSKTIFDRNSVKLFTSWIIKGLL